MSRRNQPVPSPHTNTMRKSIIIGTSSARSSSQSKGFQRSLISTAVAHPMRELDVLVVRRAAHRARNDVIERGEQTAHLASSSSLKRHGLAADVAEPALCLEQLTAELIAPLPLIAPTEWLVGHANRFDAQRVCADGRGHTQAGCWPSARSERLAPNLGRDQGSLLVLRAAQPGRACRCCQSLASREQILA